jgi:integrase
MYKLDILMFDNGERYPILMGEDGFPHFYVTLYVTTMLRTHSSVNTIVARLKAIQFLFEWERINDRSLIDEFKLGHLLSHSDIISLRDHLKLFASEVKKENKKVRSSAKVIDIESGAFKVTSGRAVTSTHHYNRITAVAEYLHFIATVVNQSRNDPEITRAINKMKIDFKNQRPRARIRNLNENIEYMTLPDGLIEEFVRVAGIDHPLNPFKNKSVKLRNHLMFRLIQETGIRRGELLSLQLTYANLTGEKCSIFVQRQHDDRHDPRKYQPVVKTKERRLHISNELARQLDDYIINHRAKTPNTAKHPYIFVTHIKSATQGQPISNSYFGNDIVGAMKRVDERFSVIHAHMFRHEWNLNFSRMVDKINATGENIISPEKEQQMRKHGMGQTSDESSRIYNERHVKNKANQVTLLMQQELQNKLHDNNDYKDKK